MQLKALTCILGLALLVILLTGTLVMALLSGNRKPDEKEHIPVVELLKNVWVMEADENGIMIFRDGQEEQYTYGSVTEGVAAYRPQEDVREQLADIVLTDGAVTDIRPKTEKINGRILSADNTYVEVEGYGRLPLSEDYKGYRIYNTLAMCTGRDLWIGYDFADLVMENGEICGLLMAKEESMEYIRVLVKSSDYASLLHEQLVLTSDTDFTVKYGTPDAPMEETHAAGEEITVGTDSAYFAGDRVTVTPGVLTGRIILKNVNRSQGIPAYRGHMELLLAEGGIAAVNEVLLEEYLYCVVPSEMPASYPEEALKAQAVCARTYAYGHMMKAGYPQYGAHVDDSTSYQVYNNILEQESTTTAVKETYGQLLYTAEGGLAGTYYYSTSCGVGSDANIWKTEEAAGIHYLNAKSISQQAMKAFCMEREQKAAEAETVQAQKDEGENGETVTDRDSPGEKLREEEAFRAFIESKNVDDFEATEGWYRWSYQVRKIDTGVILAALQKRYQANEKQILTLEGKEYVSKPIEELDKIRDLYIDSRGAGGIADELIIVTGKHTYKVISEHNIRYVLNNGESKILRQDGSEIDSPSILPSGFFVLSAGKEKENVVGYTLSGGGFGHGVGMSQNGAKQMAKSGYTADDILQFFYDDCSVRNVYEGLE